MYIIVYMYIMFTKSLRQLCIYVSELVIFVCAGPSREAAVDNPLRLVGRMILQQSYICALIAMMVN